LSMGQAGAEDLSALIKSLGHDQEARLLRLPKLAKGKAVTELRQLQATLKAAIIEWTASEGLAGSETPGKKLAADLLTSLNRIEVENSRRSDQGVAMQLPLPLAPGYPVLDARLFVLPPSGGDDDEAASPDATREWTVVLLLDLSRLGALRVDIQVGRDAIAADFQLIEFEPSLQLRASLDELRMELEEVGFLVRKLSVRHAASAELPVADLMLPPTSSSDPAARVDFHV